MADRLGIRKTKKNTPPTPSQEGSLVLVFIVNNFSQSRFVFVYKIPKERPFSLKFTYISITMSAQNQFLAQLKKLPRKKSMTYNKNR